MLLLIPTVVAIGIALLRGGSLSNLARLPLRGGGFIMASLALQLFIYLPGVRSSTVVTHESGPIYLAALALAGIGALRNWRLGTAARLAILGLALNASVIVLNGGHMPVNVSAIRYVQGEQKVRELSDPHLYGNTRLAGHSTRLVALSDIIPVYLPGGRGNVYSIGDALITAGVAALAYRVIRRPASVTPTNACGAQSA